MEAIDLDTVIVVDRTGYDEEFNMKSHPGMIGYIVKTEQDGPGKATLHIEIPIEWGKTVDV